MDSFFIEPFIFSYLLQAYLPSSHNMSIPFQKNVYPVAKISLYFSGTTGSCSFHPGAQFTGWQLTDKAPGHTDCLPHLGPAASIF